MSCKEEVKRNQLIYLNLLNLLEKHIYKIEVKISVTIIYSNEKTFMNVCKSLRNRSITICKKNLKL